MEIKIIILVSIYFVIVLFYLVCFRGREGYRFILYSIVLYLVRGFVYSLA